VKSHCKVRVSLVKRWKVNFNYDNVFYSLIEATKIEEKLHETMLTQLVNQERK
jgi:hypothetical protein